MSIETNKIKEALGILKVNDIPDIADFDVSIKKIYYELAFELHPDKNGTTSDFQNLSSAYQYLTDLYKNNKDLLDKYINQNSQQNFNDKKTDIKTRSDCFHKYKSIINEYSKALEDYFNRVKLVNLNPDDPDYNQLCNRFKEIKKNLFSLIQENPSEPWVGDCIEKIHRINVWLKSQNYSSS